MPRLMNRTALLLVAVLVVLFTAAAGAGRASAQADAGHSDPVLSRAVVARALEDRLPLETEGPYVADGERLYIFLEVANPGAPCVYTVNWHHVDRDRSFSQTLDIGRSRAWRTWVYHGMSASRVGRWHVEVVAPGGEVQAQLDSGRHGGRLVDPNGGSFDLFAAASRSRWPVR
jgi:hypothetical protein